MILIAVCSKNHLNYDKTNLLNLVNNLLVIAWLLSLSYIKIYYLPRILNKYFSFYFLQKPTILVSQSMSNHQHHTYQMTSQGNFTHMSL